MLKNLANQANHSSIGKHLIQTRLLAIDAIGELGKGLPEAVPYLETLLKAEHVDEGEQSIYFQHDLQTAGQIGWPARTLLPEILEVSSINSTLDPYVRQAKSDILKTNPANKPPAPAVTQPKTDASPTPTPLTLADVNKQLAEIDKANTDVNKSLTDLSKAMTTALGAIDKLSKQLDAQVNPPKPADK